MHRPVSSALLPAMMSALVLLTSGLLAQTPAPGPPRSDADMPRPCTEAPTALVLSGGGARGLAHIGVLQALERRGIRPTLVVGTSVGAVIGGLYASGHTAAQIDSIARGYPLAMLFRRFDPRRPQALGGLQPLVTWTKGPRGFALASNLVREAPTNAFLEALMLRGNLLARGDFDRLPIPFRAVATRLADGRAIVLAAGDLAQAVRASASIPLLFTPETIDGDQLIDGGLAANVPVAIARGVMGAGGVVIVSDVSQGLADTTDLSSPIRIATHVLGFLTSQPPESLHPGDLYLRPALGEYRMLDFTPDSIAGLEAAGRTAVDSALGDAVCGKVREGARISPAPSLPHHVGTIRVLAGGGGAAGRVGRMLKLEPGDSLDLERLRARLLSSAETSPYEAIWLRPTGRSDTVDFAIDARPHAPAQIGLGAAYDYDLGGRLWVGTIDRQPLGGQLAAWALLAADRFDQSLYLGLQRAFAVANRTVSGVLNLRSSHIRVRTFDATGHDLAPIGTREAVGFLGTEGELGHGWETGLGAEARLWEDSAGTGSALGGFVRLQQVDAVGDPRIGLEAALTGVYQRVVGAARATALRLGHGRLAIAPLARFGWGRKLPLQMTLPLGGTDGFPGLHLGERRGSRELVAGIDLRYRLQGGVFLLLEGRGGTTAGEGQAPPEADWLWGARAGVETDTPVGALRIEYGRNSLHRGVVFVRVGRWF